jgi:hypothetical protein
MTPARNAESVERLAAIFLTRRAELQAFKAYGTGGPTKFSALAAPPKRVIADAVGSSVEG